MEDIFHHFSIHSFYIPASNYRKFISRSIQFPFISLSPPFSIFRSLEGSALPILAFAFQTSEDFSMPINCRLSLRAASITVSEPRRGRKLIDFVRLLSILEIPLLLTIVLIRAIFFLEALTR